MVRALVCVSAVLALIATVSAGPVINVQAKDHIGIKNVKVKDSANGILGIHHNKVHDIAQDIDVAKRDEAGGTPIRITRAFGVKGSKMNANVKDNKGTSPKQ